MIELSLLKVYHSPKRLSYWINQDVTATSNCQPVRFLDLVCWINSHTEWQTVQIQLRSQLFWIYTVCKGRGCPRSAWQGVLKAYPFRCKTIEIELPPQKVYPFPLRSRWNTESPWNLSSWKARHKILNVRNGLLYHMRTAKIRIALRIRTVWSWPSPFFRIVSWFYCTIYMYHSYR